MSENDLQLKARLIIESAIAELKLIGMDHDDAAGLLVVQGFIRIESETRRDEMVAFVCDFNDTSGGHGERLQ